MRRFGYFIIALVAAMATAPAMDSYAFAREVRVMTSGTLAAVIEDFLPEYEKATGNKLVIILGSSEGGAADSIPERLKRQEAADAIVLGRSSLDRLEASGSLVGGTVADIVRSRMAMAVRAGLPKPDISNLENFKRALLEGGTIAYSASVSGTYLSTEGFGKLGIADQLLPKSKRVLSERVGSVLVRGEADMGFQQVSELLPFGDKITYVGPLPDEIQRVTVFSAAIPSTATSRDAGRDFIERLSSRSAYPLIRKYGLEPMSASAGEQALVAALAPTGTLRAVINLGNPVLAKQSQGGLGVTGVSVDLAGEIARRLGVVWTPIVVGSAGQVVERLQNNSADMGFVADDPQRRSGGLIFSSAYIQIEGAYAVRVASPITSMAEVDQAGVRIAVGQNSAYDLYLSREIKAATLVKVPTSPVVVTEMLARNLEVAAGVRQQIEADVRAQPGLRVLPGTFMTIRQAIGLPAVRDPIIRAYVEALVADIKREGFVHQALARHSIEGVIVPETAK